MSGIIERFGKFCLGGIVLFVLAIAGIIFVVFTASGPSVKVAQEFFDTLAVDPAAAYEMTDVAFKASTTEEDFVAFIEEHDYMRDVQNMSFPNRSVRAIDGETRYVMSGNITDSEGNITPITILLVDDGDGIQVYGMSFSPEDAPELEVVDEDFESMLEEGEL